MDILEVKNLCKVYGNNEIKINAVDNISVNVKKGEFVTVIGESGSGKSTLLNCIGGLLNPTSGEVYIKGKNIYSLDEEERTIFRRQNIGFIFQSFNLIAELNVEQNIIFPILLDYKKPEEKEVDEILNILGLLDRRHHLPSQLSGGQQQRVAIGRALITKPMLILADEPTGNLDTKTGEEVIELLLKASELYNQTILMITHNLKLTNYSKRIIKIVDGKVKVDVKNNNNRGN
ncbi:ABC transporter ATP-binding protein [Miniphocaeibacter halophilus]|uniref:ABC transporter ATP-binding protein n=1 Tax=Miniphocaeibacter halophilus TaxID=2931922 RepID=A0AC61MRS9_9FIRM|nr:ABC transporter ATP-binding protein [Miniphocaeibacter halophilus]QQK07023.1 ABC transporter ATP-binding protein [Miniphocaeibacter halophilus]